MNHSYNKVYFTTSNGIVMDNKGSRRGIRHTGTTLCLHRKRTTAAQYDGGHAMAQTGRQAAAP